MSLPAPWSLVQVRNEVFLRCTVNTGGDRGARSRAIIDSCIRQAQRMLEIQSPWLTLQTTLNVTMTDGVSVYDIPDTIDPGRIELIDVREVSTQKFWPLKPCPTQPERNSLVSSTLGRPVAWWFENQMLYVTPSPDTDSWDVLRITGFLRANTLTADTDLVVLDPEAVVQRAEIFARPRLGLPVDPSLTQAHLAYVRDLKATQTEGAGFVLGGDTSTKLRPESIDDLRLPLEAFTNAWQPPGYWGP